MCSNLCCLLKKNGTFNNPRLSPGFFFFFFALFYQMTQIREKGKNKTKKKKAQIRTNGTQPTASPLPITLRRLITFSCKVARRSLKLHYYGLD